MTSFKQIEANRRNALKSTGPRTDEGKKRSSRNAIRHGLTAETVLEPPEDPEDYDAFEEAVAADYEAKSAVERELILRLASLLWRLRRATLIETGLLQNDNGLSQEPKVERCPNFPERSGLKHLDRPWHAIDGVNRVENETGSDLNVARRFLRLENLHSGAFERLTRYEMALWRQARQIIFALDRLLWRSPLRARHPGTHRWQRMNE